MFKAKNAMISMAVVALLAACGGGGGDDDNTNPAGNPPATQPGNQNPGTQNPGTQDPGTQNPGNQTPAPTSDADLAGVLVLNSNGIMITNNGALSGQPYTAFASTQPRGADEDFEIAQNSYGLYTNSVSASGNTPVAQFGVRVGLDPAAQAQTVSTGRLAFELADQEKVGAAREVLKMEIDGVTTTRSATGEISVTVNQGAQLHVYARSSTGQETATIVSVPATQAMIVNGFDAGLSTIALNVEVALAAAIDGAAGNAGSLAALQSVKDFGSTKEDPLQISFTISNLNLAAPSTTAALAGKDITVGTRTGVKGDGGVTGYLLRVQ